MGDDAQIFNIRAPISFEWLKIDFKFGVRINYEERSNFDGT